MIGPEAGLPPLSCAICESENQCSQSDYVSAAHSAELGICSLDDESDHFSATHSAEHQIYNLDDEDTTSFVLEVCMCGRVSTRSTASLQLQNWLVAWQS